MEMGPKGPLRFFWVICLPFGRHCALALRYRLIVRGCWESLEGFSAPAFLWHIMAFYLGGFFGKKRKRHFGFRSLFGLFLSVSIFFTEKNRKSSKIRSKKNPPLSEHSGSDDKIVIGQQNGTRRPKTARNPVLPFFLVWVKRHYRFGCKRKKVSATGAIVPVADTFSVYSHLPRHFYTLLKNQSLSQAPPESLPGGQNRRKTRRGTLLTPEGPFRFRVERVAVKPTR